MKVLYITTVLLFLSICFSIAQDNAINEERFISIGGIEQWITIKGKDKTKPVILFIHGGPGSTMSQYSNNIYGAWEEDFVLVNWDQRGAGRTYGRNAPKEINEEYYIQNPLTVEQMTKDGVELTKYILDYLHKEKVILLGTSWGSVLSVKMILDSPYLFDFYVGHSQFVNFSKNLSYAYSKVYELAKSQEDKVSIEKLDQLGTPPYDNARSYGQLLLVVKNYERMNSIPAPDTWWKIAAPYDNQKDSKDRYDGDDYSFINFVGHEKLGIKSMVSNIDFEKEALEIKVPVYLIQGEQDILTAQKINKPFFDKLNTPKKEYYLLPGAAHGHNQLVVDKQLEVVKFHLSNN